MLSHEDIQSALPVHLRNSVTPEIVKTMNEVTDDPEVSKSIRENFVNYTGVLKEGRFKVEDYLHAVKFVSFRLMGYSNKDAYERTFPVRYKTIVSRGASSKDVSAYVSAYSNNKLVNLILEQSLVPSWVLNQDAYQKAINTQVELMTTARSEKVRSDAANSILTHLKRPEKKQVEIDIGIRETSGMTELRGMLTKLAEQQLTMIKSGVPTQEIAHQRLIEGEAKDVTE